MVDPEGKFEYSCLCGKQIKSTNTFRRHVAGCSSYMERAIATGYFIKCKLCDYTAQVLAQHINQKHPQITPEKYCEEYSCSLKSDYYEQNSLQKILKGREVVRERGEVSRRRKKLDGGAVVCMICSEPFEHLVQHLRQAHGTNQVDYLSKFPGAQLLSESFKIMASNRGLENGNWIARANEAGIDLTEYKTKMGAAVSAAILSNPEERRRRSSLMGKMWKDPEKKEIFLRNQKTTGIRVSARPEILAARSARLKAWRDNNPDAFYVKCTKVMHEKWSSIPERKLRDFCQEINANLKWNQQLNSKEYFKINKRGRKQIDLMDKDSKIIIELDGPQHFRPIHGKDTFKKVVEKDLELERYCVGNGFTLIRVSYSEYLYKPSIKNFNEECLNKIKNILTNNKPGIHKIGKEYGEQNV
jgi:very-short-patch-repair endonuclease